ncbi:MAG: IS1634 family transposase, partial [Luteolibacter sp.]
MLYLGEINAEQEAAWVKSITAFDSSGQEIHLCLFPENQALPPGLPAPALPIKLADYTLSRPRQYGACWLAGELWHALKFDEFWSGKLGRSREGTDWAGLLQVSVAYRLIAPGSEWRLHRHWYDESAMGDLLAGDFHWGGKDQLYEVLDDLLVHRDELFTHLKARWEDLFGVKYQLLLYDLTSTYFEGAAELIPKAKRGYSRDHRPDCKQVVIALIVTPEGFPLTYETLDGNTLDKQTLPEFIARIETKYGSAERVWIMDRGIPTEEQLAEIRQVHPSVKYLVGTPRAQVRTKRDRWESLPWEKVRDSVEVKRFEEAGELYVVAKSGNRTQKEMAMRRRRLVELLRSLRKMRRESNRDRLLQRVGVARSKAGRAAKLVS